MLRSRQSQKKRDKRQTPPLPHSLLLGGSRSKDPHFQPTSGTHATTKNIRGSGSLFRDISRRRFLIDEQAGLVKLDDVPGRTGSLFSNLTACVGREETGKSTPGLELMCFARALLCAYVGFA